MSDAPSDGRPPVADDAPAATAVSTVSSDAAAPPPPRPEPVLELDGVTVGAAAAADGYDVGLAGATLAVRPGELCLVRLEADAPRTPLADVACGVLDPEAGTVRFRGQDWRRMGFRRSARDRGRIGRTFASAGWAHAHGWVNNLDVDENVLLAQRHVGGRSDADLRTEVTALATAFGLPDGALPPGRPAAARRGDLARAALVRAFLGEPVLLLLERPEAGLPADAVPPLLAAVAAARRRGAAVLWLTSAAAPTWRDPAVDPTERWAMEGAELRIAD